MFKKINDSSCLEMLYLKRLATKYSEEEFEAVIMPFVNRIGLIDIMESFKFDGEELFDNYLDDCDISELELNRDAFYLIIDKVTLKNKICLADVLKIFEYFYTDYYWCDSEDDYTYCNIILLNCAFDACIEKRLKYIVKILKFFNVDLRDLHGDERTENCAYSLFFIIEYLSEIEDFRDDLIEMVARIDVVENYELDDEDCKILDIVQDKLFKMVNKNGF